MHSQLTKRSLDTQSPIEGLAYGANETVAGDVAVGGVNRLEAARGPNLVKGRDDLVDLAYQSTPQFLSDARWMSTLPSSHEVLVPKSNESLPASEVAWLDSSS